LPFQKHQKVTKEHQQIQALAAVRFLTTHQLQIKKQTHTPNTSHFTCILVRPQTPQNVSQILDLTR
jgi:hypothetical protein